MIVGRPLGKGEERFRTIVGYSDSVIISYKTFQNGIGDEAGSSLVVWLLVAESKSLKLSFIKLLRQQGVRRRMLITLIKQSTLHCCLTKLLGDDVYLQHPHKEPMAFYHGACGCLQSSSQDIYRHCVASKDNC